MPVGARLEATFYRPIQLSGSHYFLSHDRHLTDSLSIFNKSLEVLSQHMTSGLERKSHILLIVLPCSSSVAKVGRGTMKTARETESPATCLYR